MASYHGNLDVSETYSSLVASQQANRDEAMAVMVKAYRNGNASLGRLSVTHVGHLVTAEFHNIASATFRITT